MRIKRLVILYKNVHANQTIIAKYEQAKFIEKKDKVVNTLLSEIKATELGFALKHQENEFDEFAEEILLPHKLSENGPFIAKADVNTDGLEDVFIGGAANQAGVLYLQKENGKFIESTSQPWRVDKASEDLGILFLDADGDGHQDIYVTSGGSEFKQGDRRLQDRLYLNDGKGNFSKDLKAIPSIYEST
jgi:hypothetical protein